MSLQTSPLQTTDNPVVDLRSIDLPAVNGRRLQRARLAGRLAEQGISLSLVHLDVALDVKAESGDDHKADSEVSFKVSAKPLAHAAAIAEAAPAEKSEDPVMRRLSDALAATETAHDPHAAICADALRLAILTRQVSRQARAAEAAANDDQPACRNVRSLQKWRLKRVIEYVDGHLTGRITLQDLAAVAGLSRMHFAAQFRAATGLRPHEYLLKRRIERAEELLKRGEMPLVHIALTVGFQTQAHFTTVFKRFAGETPYQWRSAYLAQATPLPARAAVT